jgi:hypothetical protein
MMPNVIPSTPPRPGTTPRKIEHSSAAMAKPLVLPGEAYPYAW